MREYVTEVQTGVAAAGNVDTVVGPTVVCGVYQDEQQDTTPVGTTMRLSVSPRGGSPNNPITWTAAGPASGDVFDAANPGGRFNSWGLYIPPKCRLRLEWAGAGAGAPNLAAVIEHDRGLAKAYLKQAELENMGV